MSLLSKVKPKPQPYELDAFLAPGHFFFCRRIAIPSELERGEEENFALLELESMSPFPLEHLYYGFRLDAERHHAFVFAAYKRRFEPSETVNWRRLDAALPDFMVALGLPKGDGQSLALVTDRSFLLFAFDEASSLPSRFYAEARETPADETTREELGRQLDAFCLRAPADMRAKSSRRWIANTEARWLGQDAWFGAVELDETPAAKVSFSRDAIWKADLRDPETVAKAQRDERQNTFLWKIVVGIAAAVCLLLAGEFVWGASKGYLAMIRSANEGRKPLVEEIDALQATSTSLSAFQESNVEPFRINEALVPYQKWPAIVYKKIETSGPDSVVIDARADNAMEVTEFKKRLERFNKVTSVDISGQRNSPSGSTFTATIRFVPFAFSAPKEVASGE